MSEEDEADALDAAISAARARLGEQITGMTAGEFAPHLPEELRRAYWRRKLTEFFEAEEQPTPSEVR
jgi:hypothetical protein